MTIIDMDKMGEALNTKADIDLNNTGVFSTSEGGVVNLTSSTPANASGKEVTSADFFQSNLLNYTTNRILEIPQDIKLELNNGTLTLKAGSKVYVPNGPDVFVKKTTSSDLTLTNGWGNQQFFVYLDINNNLCMREVNFTESGSNSSLTTQYRCWYDTTNNSIKWTDDTGSTWREGFSFPIALITADASSITSIDQVFNGFGYIGSTVFTLPGVKGEIPNGRNEDGTCKSIVTTTTKVYTFTPTLGNVNDVGVWLRSEGTITATNEFYYDSDKNQIIYSQDNTALTNICVAKFNWVDGKVASWMPYTVDSVVNSNLSNLSAAGEAKLKSNIQLVNELPANPEPGVLYCIPEA